MVRDRPLKPGTNQHRYRCRLDAQGWRPFCSYLSAEHRDALKQIQRQHGLTTLHEALELALSQSALPPFNGAPPPSARNLPCLTLE